MMMFMMMTDDDTIFNSRLVMRDGDNEIEAVTAEEEGNVKPDGDARSVQQHHSWEAKELPGTWHL